MLLKYFYDDKLAQASYLLGCPASGLAMLIDPSRNIAPYLAAAKQNSLRIVYVTETHIHADFLSGIRELAHATNATMLLSGEGGTDWSYQFPEEDKVKLLHDGESFMLGGIKVEVLHTAGHTPEHLSFMVTDTGANAPMGIFTGDFLFAGDVGRPDLLEEVAGQADTREIGAVQQFQNIQRFKQFADYLQIWPGHGAGSACGKALGAVPSTTLGYEKLFNPAFQINDESAFVQWLLEGQPEAPKYFAEMKQVNKAGAALLIELAPVEKLEQMPKNALIIDTRSPSEFAKGYWQGTINIPISSTSFPSYLGWYVDYEQPLYFIAHPEKLDMVLTAMRSIGVDKIAGYFTPESLEKEAKIAQKTPQEIYDAGYKILDVRGMSEYQSEHIPNALHIHMGLVPQHLDELPRDEIFAVQCESGLRSQMVVSILQKHGFTNVVNMKGGIGAWKVAKLPIEQN
jgi:hydroxyacylglutathione hydrolase